MSHVVDDENVQQHESQFVVTTIYDTYRDNPNASELNRKSVIARPSEDDRVIEFTLFILLHAESTKHLLDDKLKGVKFLMRIQKMPFNLSNLTWCFIFFILVIFFRAFRQKQVNGIRSYQTSCKTSHHSHQKSISVE